MPSHENRTYPSSATLIRATAATDKTADELLAAARARATEPEIFDEFPPKFFGSAISTAALDSWGTRMDVSSLRRYASDAIEGRSVLDSHNIEHLIGKSVDGRYVENAPQAGAEAGVEKRAESVFFIIPGQRTATGMMTDDYINQLRAGVYRDISIGFTLPPDAYIHCDVCGKRMNEWMTSEACFHFPGMWMDVEREGGRQRVFVTGTVTNAGLSEYSPVYDGATPGAEVIAFPIAKALDMEDADALDRNTAERLTQRYNVRFRRALRSTFALGGREDTGMVMDSTRAMREAIAANTLRAEGDPADDVGPAAGTDNAPVAEPQDAGAAQAAAAAPVENQSEVLTEFPEDEEESAIAAVDASIAAAAEDAGTDAPLTGDEATEQLTDEQRSRLTPAQVSALNARHAATGIRLGTDAVDALIGRVTTLTETNRSLRAKVRELEGQAADGKRFRESIIAETIAHAKRNHTGEAAGFDEDQWRKRLDKPSNTTEDLEFFRDNEASKADKRFPRGPQLRSVPAGETAQATGTDATRRVGFSIHADQ